MPVSEQTYAATMSSPLMTVPLQQVYWALQSWGELTKGEITAALKANGVQQDEANPWEKQVPILVKMGVLKRGNKRHCRAKNKEDAVWVLLEKTPVKPRAAKPSAKAYLKAVAQFEMVIAHHDGKGDGMITAELRKLYEWTRDKVDK
jgi:hypothetical protein